MLLEHFLSVRINGMKTYKVAGELYTYPPTSRTRRDAKMRQRFHCWKWHAASSWQRKRDPHYSESLNYSAVSASFSLHPFSAKSNPPARVLSFQPLWACICSDRDILNLGYRAFTLTSAWSRIEICFLQVVEVQIVEMSDYSSTLTRNLLIIR